MKLIIKVITLYFLVLIPALAEIESIINVCNEESFLKCTNKSKQECINSFNLSASYCAKKHEKDIDWNNFSESRKVRTECAVNSVVAYFDNDVSNFNVCFSKTNYSKRLKKESINELCIKSDFVKCLGVSSKECVNIFTALHKACTLKDSESVCTRKKVKVMEALKTNRKKLKICAAESGIIKNGSE